jgi:hypothetical protein
VVPHKARTQEEMDDSRRYTVGTETILPYHSATYHPDQAQKIGWMDLPMVLAPVEEVQLAHV